MEGGTRVAHVVQRYGRRRREVDYGEYREYHNIRREAKSVILVATCTLLLLRSGGIQPTRVGVNTPTLHSCHWMTTMLALP